MLCRRRESFRPVAESIQRHAIEFGLELVMPHSEEAIERRNMQLNGSRAVPESVGLLQRL